MAFTALFDARVLYPAPLCDILLRLACANLFRARWSAQIHDEWMRNLLLKRPDLVEKLPRTRDAMDRAVADCLVVGHEVLIPGLVLPDPDDRHVLAAAIVGRADVIVTFNPKDFPAARSAATASRRSTRMSSSGMSSTLTRELPFPRCGFIGPA